LSDEVNHKFQPGLKFTCRNFSRFFFADKEKPMKIADRMYVAIEYTLTLDSGREVDRSQEGRPLGFITGASQIIPGLEKALAGMAVGDAADIIVEPEDGYGVVSDDLFREVPRSQFPGDVEIKEGMAFEAQGPHGPFMLVVSSVNDNDTVTVDLNHPMAGQRLHFAVKVVEVREAGAEEITRLNSGCGCGCGTGGQDECSSSGCNCG
jgi:FKBP-type peptidyl-prolyl cis-trans isomerase SlyD